MTIQQLLRHHGHNCARRVLPSGRLVFDSAATRLSLGAATPGLQMSSHTFHGGDEVEDGSDGPPWWMSNSALDRDRAEMDRFFPSFVEIPGDSSTAPAWFGTVETQAGEFKVGIVHRFDHTLPAVVPLAPKRRGRQRGRRFEAAPHLYTNGNLCVASVEDWDETRDSVATVVAWAAHWHAFYVEWLFTGRWPAESYVAEAA